MNGLKTEICQNFDCLSNCGIVALQKNVQYRHPHDFRWTIHKFNNNKKFDKKYLFIKRSHDHSELMNRQRSRSIQDFHIFYFGLWRVPFTSSGFSQRFRKNAAHANLFSSCAKQTIKMQWILRAYWFFELYGSNME